MITIEIPRVELTKEQTAELQRLKAYYPFRHAYGAIAPDGTWQCGAVPTKRVPNKLARSGHTVFILHP